MIGCLAAVYVDGGEASMAVDLAIHHYWERRLPQLWRSGFEEVTSLGHFLSLHQSPTDELCGMLDAYSEYSYN